MKKKLQVRALAALAISKLIKTRQNLTAILPGFLQRIQEKKDQSFLQELCYGVMRYYHKLDYLVDNLLETPLRSKDIDIKVLLMAGLYQAIHLRTPAHAMVSATVEACVDLRKPWAKNLVNAILRKFQRNSEHLLQSIEANFQAFYSHPQWLLDILMQDFPHEWQSICTRNNDYPPMYLRVNRRKIPVDQYLEMLNQANIPATLINGFPDAIKLDTPVDVQKLPGFNHGYVSVQDLAAQLTPCFLDLHPGQKVLDACAAPGGKLAHMLEFESQLNHVVAVENDVFRFEKLVQTLERLQLQATLHRADVLDLHSWWNGEKFDRILLDAPCSAIGVIRRHPDIKFLRNVKDVEIITETQSKLLETLWPLLNTGGKLLYITCSILKDENDNQIKKFITSHKKSNLIIPDAEWGYKTEYGRQILPGQNDMDGFYYACLQKI